MRVLLGALLLAASLAGGSSGVFAAEKIYHVEPEAVRLSGVHTLEFH